MTETRPTGEQLRFVSADTGEHILDTYLEAAEKGGRTLPDMLADIYDPDTGLFRADLFEFRVTTDLKLQFRVGDFPDLITGWRDVEGNPYVFFKPRGTWAPATAYIQTDLVRYQNATYYALSSHTSASVFDATKWSTVLDDTELDTAIAAAAASAAAAAASQSAAATSATNAASSASTATTKASEASASASAAATSASNAATSASDALTSETNADASEAAAATSASNAASSASTASTQASNAATSATNAANSATAAAGSASAASTSASNAATSAANADTSEANAAASAANAATSETNAANSATAAATSATNAANSASAASTSAANSASSAASALAAETNTLAIFDQFGDQYLGPKASDPTVDNDGDPLTNGDIYWNTTNNTLRFYNGTAWVAPETVATTAATNAQTSATDAASSASAAATSASNAATSASTAATQASNASTSATNAAASEAAAAASATAASGSASTASTQASNASTSATSAANSASSASTSASNAATSASTAAASEANAVASEAYASSFASSAASSASSASTSASNAATSATDAANSASSAATQASNASTSATNAANSASTASTHASNAATSETNAAASAASAAAVFDSFDDRYLGNKPTNPLYDNDGNALTEGTLYWNDVVKEMRVWDGSAWISLSSAGGASYVDDLADVSATSPTTGDILRFNGTDWAKYADSAYAAASHTHSISNTTGLQTALDSKLDDSQATAFGLSLLDDADAATARTTMGLGTIATQNSNSVTISGGSVTGITDLAVADGGTGASTAADARTNLSAAGTGVTNTFTASQIISVTDNTNAALRITQLGTGHALVVEDETNPDSTPFVVSPTGSVGVGTTSPLSKVDVVSNSAGGNGPFLLVRNTSGATPGTFGPGIQFDNAVSGKHGYLINQSQSSGSQLLVSNPSSPYDTYLAIDQSGNVGVGTASPQVKLDVNTVSDGTLARMTTTGTSGYVQLVANNDWSKRVEVTVRDNGSYGSLWAGSDNLTWDRNGQVGIGRTPSNKLDVEGRGRFMQDGGGTTGAVVIRQPVGDGSGGIIQWVDNANANQKGYIQVGTDNVMHFVAGGVYSYSHNLIGYNIAAPSNYYNGLQLEIQATSGTAGIGLHRAGYSHVGIYHDTTNWLGFNFSSGTVSLAHSTGQILGTGNFLGWYGSIGVGNVGTYAMLAKVTTGAANEGVLIAGSELRYNNAAGGSTTGGTPSGTWRVMGNVTGSASQTGLRVSVFLRVS